TPVSELFSSPLMLPAASGLMLLFAGWFLMLALRYRRRQDKQLAHLHRDFRALTAAARGVGQRVLEIERRQRNLAERQDQLDLYDAANQSYDQAISLVHQGMGVTELVKNCGLSEGEAELIYLLHRLDRTA
ncbi:MAG TPA: DUF2802 domain-containing protein, partial [Gammaproteobacteria bacterium]|nr:DUF2802 domain-containing protein [Gammaproteobacteria bacterium]